ncbi:MAG: hypothetical protein U0401_20085 [Anaerolineae bacterium]
MTKFKQITTVTDDWELKSDYLNFIKNKLYRLAEAQGSSETSLAEAEEIVDDVSFSAFSAGWVIQGFVAPAQMTLFSFGHAFTCYLTTSYHNFIEEALKKAGKTPVPKSVAGTKG